MDWMKVETNTPDKPEMLQIARMCKVSQAVAFLAWFKLYRWFDSNTVDGQFEFLTKEDCDSTAGLHGIGEALAFVKWVEFYDDGGACVFKWDKHNGRSAKRRALDGSRKAVSRAEET